MGDGVSFAAVADPMQELVDVEFDGTAHPDDHAGPGPKAVHDARTPWWRRLLLFLYWGGAIVLVPWIVMLKGDLPATAIVHHIPILRAGVSGLLVIGMLATARWFSQRSHLTVVAGTCTATVAFVAAWFMIVSTSGSRVNLTLVYGLGLHVPVIVVSLLAVRRHVRGQRPPARPPALIVRLLVIGALAYIPLIATAIAGAPSELAAHHLALTRTGLDVFECIGFATIGWCLLRRIPILAVATSFLGALMVCDAWYDVVTTAASSRVSSVALACLELPLAALSVGVARHEVLRWPKCSLSPKTFVPQGEVVLASHPDLVLRPRPRRAPVILRVQPSSISLRAGSFISDRPGAGAPGVGGSASGQREARAHSDQPLASSRSEPIS